MMKIKKKITISHIKGFKSPNHIALRPQYDEIHLDCGISYFLMMFLEYPIKFHGKQDPMKILSVLNKKDSCIFDWVKEYGLIKEEVFDLISTLRLMAMYANSTNGLIDFNHIESDVYV